jgi:hypothetical protein
MNSHLVRSNAILPFAAESGVDLTGKEGFPVWIDTPTKTARLVADAMFYWPFGVVVQGRPAAEKSSIAVSAAGLAGTVRVKLLQDVPYIGDWLQLVEVNDQVAFGPDAGSGSRIIMGMALEPGAAGELIEAVIWLPFQRT